MTDNIELIDKRLAEARVLIPVTIKEIMSTNFQQITTKMNNDIKEKMRTPLSYLNLYDQKIYIDQLLTNVTNLNPKQLELTIYKYISSLT